MKLLITGAAGFLGRELVRELLSRSQLNGQVIESVVLTDRVPSSDPGVIADSRVQVHQGDLYESLPELFESVYDGVFHLASAVSAECEADFSLGLRANLATTQALLEKLRNQHTETGLAAKLFFASSVAVFGGDAGLPMPPVITDATLPVPQSSYGVHKFVCEQLIADYTRKGFIDGRVARLMTVCVRPGRPNGAASSFLSGIIREPLAGQSAICPVDPETKVALASPQNTIAGILRVTEASRDELAGRTAINLPALSLTVADMLAALEDIAGSETRALVSLEPDATIAKVVGSWPGTFDSARAKSLGLRADASFHDIIHQYIDSLA
ncbi:D-erythronate dehydrogenase [Orrella daihaiensis]|uniref:NAD-dependent epimerase/dehydratase family protein n=1 Tax=Orrella daihaiensis TaxID=2782176 RepID=A0ABY4AHV1_9BURK|nr:D-erythronate dehydrogenase [Orrella daihaiensis]UOD49764.1 NAD-dependent epimerase/dehydratase family protein [Orrella daihaiensis]